MFWGGGLAAAATFERDLDPGNMIIGSTGPEGMDSPGAYNAPHADRLGWLLCSSQVVH